MKSVKSVWMRVAAISVIVAACGGGGGGATNPPPGGGGGGGGGGGQTCSSTSDQVTVANNNFSPRCTTVAPGTTITWTWNSGGLAHNVTFATGPNSGNLTDGTFTRNFPTAGTFTYQCTIHGQSMSGEIRVQQ